jgi:hypothetical protein
MCDCEGCQEFRAVHARPCPEVPEHERVVKRVRDAAAQRRWQAATVTVDGSIHAQAG